MDGRLIHSTNRFHADVRVLNNEARMMSKCGKNEKVTHELLGDCVTEVLTRF